MKNKEIFQKIKAIHSKYLFRIIPFCVVAFGTYTSYTANKLNNFIAEVEEQNVVLRTTVSVMRAEINNQQKQIQNLKKFCIQPEKGFLS